MSDDTTIPREEVLVLMRELPGNTRQSVSYWPPRYNPDGLEQLLLDELARVTGKESLQWWWAAGNQTIVNRALDRCQRVGVPLEMFICPKTMNATSFARRWLNLKTRLGDHPPEIVRCVVDHEMAFYRPGPEHRAQNDRVHAMNTAIYDACKQHAPDAPVNRYNHGAVGYSGNRWWMSRYSSYEDLVDEGWSISIYDPTDEAEMRRRLELTAEVGRMFQVDTGSIWTTFQCRRIRPGDEPIFDNTQHTNKPYPLTFSKKVGSYFGGDDWYTKSPDFDPGRAARWSWVHPVKRIVIWPGPGDYGSDWGHIYTMLKEVRR